MHLSICNIMLSYATVQKYPYKIWEIKIQCTWEKYMYKHHYTIYSITGWLKDNLHLYERYKNVLKYIDVIENIMNQETKWISRKYMQQWHIKWPKINKTKVFTSRSIIKGFFFKKKCSCHIMKSSYRVILVKEE